MIKLTFVIGILFSTLSQAAHSPTHYNIETAKKRCLTNYNDSPELFMGEFHWGYTLLEMGDKFQEVYDSGKRIDLHANYDQNDKIFKLYYEHKEHSPIIKIDNNFIKSVTRQVEISIEEGFSDFVFFPDMGHAHLHFPEQHWLDNYSNMDVSPKGQPKLYEKMFADKKMRPLYHLTEQLKMLDENKELIQEESLLFKYWNRNFFGSNDASDQFEVKMAPDTKKYNTVGVIEGYKSWSAGFAVSASKDGCFPYRDKDGETRYFDISLRDPRYDPSQVFDEDP